MNHQHKVSDAIKDMLYARTAEKVQTLTPGIMNSVFDVDEALKRS